MKLASLLRLEIRRALGLYLEGKMLHRVEVAHTLFGTKVVVVDEQPAGELALDEAPSAAAPEHEGAAEPQRNRLGSILHKGRAMVAKMRRVVAVGLPTGAGYFVAIEADRREELAAAGGPLAAYLSGEAPVAPDLLPDQVVAKIGKTNYLLAAAAKESDVRRLLGFVDEADRATASCELAAPAALRTAWREVAPAARSASEVRLWLGDRYSLVSLSRGRRALAWEEVPRSPDGAHEALVAATVRVCRVAAVKTGAGRPQRLVLQGSPEDALMTRLGEVTGLEPEVLGERCLDGLAIAEGLAIGALANVRPALNLARSIQPPPSTLSALPWAEAAAIVVATVLLGSVLGGRLLSLETSLQVARDSQQHMTALAEMTNEEIEMKVQEDDESVGPLAEFLAGGVSWSSILLAIPNTLPEGAWIKALTAEDSTWTGESQDPGDRYLSIRETAPIGTDGTMPRGMQESVAALRASAVGDLFPDIRLTNVQRERQGKVETTGFSIICRAGEVMEEFEEEEGESRGGEG